MIRSVVIGGKEVVLSREAQIVALRTGVERDTLGNLLAECPRIIRQNGTLTRVNVDDIRTVINGKECMRAPQRYFIGQILELNLVEGWYTKGGVSQLQAHVDDTLFVLPRKEEKQPPFLGHPLRYSVTRVRLSEEWGTFIVFVKFYRLRKVTEADLHSSTT
ncbi:MAG: hypothetical protein AAB458_01775 [Patescibacteria group bacterium]